MVFFVHGDGAFHGDTEEGMATRGGLVHCCGFYCSGFVAFLEEQHHLRGSNSFVFWRNRVIKF